MNENIIGRAKCPVCGEDSQDVKVNKNGNVYMICDNGCRVNFSRTHSKKIKASLAAGKGLNISGLFFNGVKTNDTGTNREQTTGTNTGISGTTGNPVNGRTDGKLAGVQRPAADNRGGRSILGSFFADDDDE